MLELVEAVAQKLKSSYEDYDIVNDRLEQKFKNVFYIEITNDFINYLTANQFKIKCFLTINVFNENNDINRISQICYELFDLLRLLDVLDFKVRGYNYSFNIFENMGRVKITYDLKLDNREEINKIRKYNMKVGVNVEE